jgi:hypothetical protein
MYRLVVENLLSAHIFEDRGVDKNGLRKITRENLALLAPWILRRWAARLEGTLDGTWPTYKTVDRWLRDDPAFARLPTDEIEHFR